MHGLPITNYSCARWNPTHGGKLAPRTRPTYIIVFVHVNVQLAAFVPLPGRQRPCKFIAPNVHSCSAFTEHNSTQYERSGTEKFWHVHVHCADQICIGVVNYQSILGSIVVSISACHAEDPGSIPGRGGHLFFSVFLFVFIVLSRHQLGRV